MLKKYMVWVMITGMMAPGCRKFVQVGDPETSLGTATVFSGDETAKAALMGMYSRAMAVQGYFLNGGNTLYPSLSADECILTQSSPALDAFSGNVLTSNNIYIAPLYSSAYNTLYNANMLLENLDHSKQVSAPVRRQIMGEALFVRALVFSRLVVLWGWVGRLVVVWCRCRGVRRWMWGVVLRGMTCCGMVSWLIVWRGCRGRWRGLGVGRVRCLGCGRLMVRGIWVWWCRCRSRRLRVVVVGGFRRRRVG